MPFDFTIVKAFREQSALRLTHSCIHKNKSAPKKKKKSHIALPPAFLNYSTLKRQHSNKMVSVDKPCRRADFACMCCDSVSLPHSFPLRTLTPPFSRSRRLLGPNRKLQMCALERAWTEIKETWRAPCLIYNISSNVSTMLTAKAKQCRRWNI